MKSLRKLNLNSTNLSALVFERLKVNCSEKFILLFVYLSQTRARLSHHYYSTLLYYDFVLRKFVLGDHKMREPEQREVKKKFAHLHQSTKIRILFSLGSAWSVMFLGVYTKFLCSLCVSGEITISSGI